MFFLFFPCSVTRYADSEGTSWFPGPIDSTRWRFRCGARWRAALVLDGTDRSGALELACGGMLSDGGMCAGSPGGRSPVRFPGVCRRGKAGFWRSVEVEEEASAGRKQRGGSFAAGWGTETDPVHAGGRSRLTPIVFDTGRAPLICDGLMVASRRRDPAAVCASRRNSGTAGRSSDYRIFTNFVHPSRVRWFCSLLRCKWKLPLEASQGGVLERVEVQEGWKKSR